MFQLALRLEHRDRADVGNRADALHGMALAASHAGCTRTTLRFLCSILCHMISGDGFACSRNLTLALAAEIEDAMRSGVVADQRRSFEMSPFACVMAAWCALRSDNLRMLRIATSIFAQVMTPRFVNLSASTLTLCIACSREPWMAITSQATRFPSRSHRCAHTIATRPPCFCSCSVKGSTIVC